MINFPKKITAGDSLSLDIAPQYLGGVMYSATNYSLKIILRGIGGSVDIDATQDGNKWVAVMTPLQSQALQAGTFKWSAIASAGSSERVTLQNGYVQAEVNLAEVTNFDTRTIEQIELEAIKKVLGTFSANGKVQKYTIGSRQMEFVSMADLTKEKHRLTRIVLNQLGKNTDLLVRFSNGV